MSFFFLLIIYTIAQVWTDYTSTLFIKVKKKNYYSKDTQLDLITPKINRFLMNVDGIQFFVCLIVIIILVDFDV